MRSHINNKKNKEIPFRIRCYPFIHLNIGIAFCKLLNRVNPKGYLAS